MRPSIALALFVISTVGGACSGPRTNASPASGAAWWSIAALVPPPGAEEVLIGGRIADTKDFPASFYAVRGVERCTSTMVGPRTLLTAAHCVDDGAMINLTLEAREYPGQCVHAPDYKMNHTADWALCLMAQDVPSHPYETLNVDSHTLAVGVELLLSGFGCTRPRGGGNDGVYRIGEARVIKLPSATKHELVTRGEVALCYGDSGGPAFVFLDAGKTKRVQVAVNAQGNIHDTSYLAPLSAEAAKRFLYDWSRRYDVWICGLHTEAPRCRIGS